MSNFFSQQTILEIHPDFPTYQYFVPLSCLVVIPLYENTIICLGFPGGTSGKEHTSQCRRQKRRGFNPWVGKIPWSRAWQPTLVFLPGESHGQRSLVGFSP